MPEMTASDATFAKDILQSEVPVLVDFWAPWCGPCRIMGPIISKLAEEFAGKPIKVAKLNVDENQKTGEQYGIMSIPTILMFKGGQVVEQMVGVVAEDVLRQKIQALL